MDQNNSSKIKNVIHDWPGNYTSITACVLVGFSSEYPLIAKSFHEPWTYLIPCSIFCASSNYSLSKSQRSKFDAHCGIPLGIFPEFIVKKHPDVERDFTVKAFSIGAKDGRRLPNNSWHFKVNCIISDEMPPRCFCKDFGAIHFPSHVLNTTPIPNVVYEAFIVFKLIIKNNNGIPSGAATQVEVRPELSRIIRVKPLISRIYREHIELLRSCPWNVARLQRGEVRLETDNWSYEYEEEEEYDGAPRKTMLATRPPLPQRILQVLLWYFENNQIVRSRVPKTLVKMNTGMEKMKWENFTSNEKLRYPHLEEGQSFDARIVYNEFLSCYYVENYHLIKNSSSNNNKQTKLEKRVVIEGGCSINEYAVSIRESTLFRDFYICDPLNYNLIADPKRVLRNIIIENHRVEGCPVWIRLEPDHARLAHFSISALDKNAGKFTSAEKMMSFPNIHGIGLLVDLVTSAVFSENHPQKKIRLSNFLKNQVPLGNFFYFSAAYWPLRQLYLIGNIQLLPAERRSPINTFSLDNKLIFEDRFRCYSTQMEDTHMGNNFGPFIDPMSFISNKARKEKTDWPLRGEGFVCFNPSWEAGRDTQMMLYSLELDSQANNVTSTVINQEEKWWERQLKDACNSCCDEIWHLLYSLKQKSKEKEIFNDEKIVKLEKILKDYQENISLE